MGPSFRRGIAARPGENLTSNPYRSPQPTVWSRVEQSPGTFFVRTAYLVVLFRTAFFSELHVIISSAMPWCPSAQEQKATEKLGKLRENIQAYHISEKVYAEYAKTSLGMDKEEFNNMAQGTSAIVFDANELETVFVEILGNPNGKISRNDFMVWARTSPQRTSWLCWVAE